MNWLFNNISLSSCNFMSYTYTWSHNVLLLMQVLKDQFSRSHSSERCPGILQMTANEGSIPGSVPWIICKEGCCTVSLSPSHPQIPFCTHIHPCEAFTHSLRLWSVVCQRLLPLKRRWQPLIITQAERRAFLSAEILPHTHTYISSTALYIQTWMQRNTTWSPLVFIVFDKWVWMFCS